MRRARGSCEPCPRRARNSWPPVCTSSMCFNRDVEDEAVKEPNYVNQTHKQHRGRGNSCRLCRRYSPRRHGPRCCREERSRKAFEILVKRHQERIFLVARRITRRREDAEDVVQQSFQKAFTHLRKFEGRSAFSTWLTRIAITEALMLLRRSRGLREVLIDDLNGNEETTTALQIPDASPDPEASYSQRERAEMLSLAMNELSPGTRKAIRLRELDERSSEEAARIMGISVSALKGRMFHGRRKFASD